MSLPLVYLGTHKAGWLGWIGVPLFVSRRQLFQRRTLPRAEARWALDSGGFSELSLFGRWETTPRQYAAEVRRYAAEIGRLDWAAIQDWMCEPFMLQKTGLALAEHQRRTVESFETLRELAPEIPWAPVLQGFARDDYLRCVEMYERRGHDLRRAPVVGVGSVCRRQATGEAERFLRELHGMGLRLHGFGFKVQGLRRVADVLASSDSLAWSLDARRAPPLFGCTHKSCANCSRWALAWHSRLLRRLELNARQYAWPFAKAV